MNLDEKSEKRDKSNNRYKSTVKVNIERLKQAMVHGMERANGQTQGNHYQKFASAYSEQSNFSPV